MSATPDQDGQRRTVSSRIGEEVDGRYRIVKVLGEGGMGTVYEAQHTRIGRRVAIKFLQPTLAANPEIVARFRREAQAAGSMEHENIAAATDFGSAPDGSPYIVMEYLAGEDLAHLLVREGQLPVPRSVFIAIQACRGLDAAHRRGVIHRDLKPENLFVCSRADGSDLVKILDFGIAKLRDPEGGVTTRTGAAMGTPYYMSIEQARGAKDVDHRADIYSLGVILYEILSGQKPHPGETWNEIMYHILTQPPVPLERLRPGLPEGLGALVRRAMDSAPANRPRSAADFAGELAAFAGRVVTPLRSQVVLEVAPSADVTVRGADAVKAPEASTSPRTSTTVGTAVAGDPPTSGKSRFGAGVAVGGVAAVVAVVIALLVSRTAWRPQQEVSNANASADADAVLVPAPAASTEGHAEVAVAAASAAAPSAEVSDLSAGQTPGRPPGHGAPAANSGSPQIEQEKVPPTPAAPATDAPASTTNSPPSASTRSVRTPRPYETSNPYE